MPILCTDTAVLLLMQRFPNLISHMVIPVPACYRMGSSTSLIDGNREVHCLNVCHECSFPAGLFFSVCVAPCMKLDVVLEVFWYFIGVACEADTFSFPCKLWKNLKLLKK